jgi:hypothetical protein
VKAKLVKDLMVPLSEYATVSQEATLGEAVAALKQAQADYDQTKYRHRAILVYDQDQKIVGKVNFQSILKALEPKYDDMLSDAAPSHLGFTRTLQKSIIDQFKLWQDPLDNYSWSVPGRMPSIPVHGQNIYRADPEGKGALAVFLLAGTWWVFEVVPIGVTSLAIGVLQAFS